MEVLYFIPFIVLFAIAMSMVIQGWMIMNESHGYQENPKIKGHPEMKGVKKGDGLMVVSFDEMPMTTMMNFMVAFKNSRWKNSLRNLLNMRMRTKNS